MLLGFQMTKRAQTSAVQAFPIKPSRKSSSTSRSNQTKLKLITFTGYFNAFSTGRKLIGRAKGDPGAIGKSKEDLRD